jgi:hypothetical protein
MDWCRRLNVRVSSLTVMLVASMLAPREAWPQEDRGTVSPVIAGTRVRLSSATALRGQVHGTVMDMDEESLLLSTDDHRPLGVSREAISGLEVSNGRRGNATKGALIGAASGAALFAIMPAEGYCTGLPPRETCYSQCQFIGPGALSGAVWGGLIGHLVKRDRWVTVPLAAARVSVAPTNGEGVKMSFAVAW